MKYYYSTQPYLARCINRYFYGGKHYVYVSEEFYPYRQPNPKSSNPFLIYQDLYQPSKDKDDFDKFILQTRFNLRKGILAQQLKPNSPISSQDASRLNRICDKVDIVFFYPIVYRIERDKIDKVKGRLKQGGSAVTAGSREYVIEDLDEGEFDELFLDLRGDHEFEALLSASVGDSSLAFDKLEKRC